MTTNNIQEIGSRLISLREYYGHNQRQFALKCGIHPTSYPKYEKGQQVFKVDICSRIAIAFPELNIRWLLTGQGEMILPQAEILSEHPETTDLSRLCISLEKSLEDKEKIIQLQENEKQGQKETIKNLEQELAELKKESPGVGVK